MSGGGPRVVDGRFELVRRLGGGGMGTVWRARDLALHRDVALKEVRPPGADEDMEGVRTLRARVLREARALARVEHPHVVTIHHIVDGGEGTYPWLVMELVTGGSLQDRLDRGRMTPPDAARLGRDLLAALVAAHAHGIEHRDVKPANVLLRPDGRPVLTDFGIAAVQESTRLTATGSVIGSPDYMAPERVRGRASGPPADLWSLGMLLYVAVEGRHPLRRDSTLATLAAVLHDEVPEPRYAGPLTGVLMALLVHDPAARPDAAALDRQLARAAGELPEPVDRSETPQPGPAGGDCIAAPSGTTSYRIAPPGPGPGAEPGPADGAGPADEARDTPVPLRAGPAYRPSRRRAALAAFGVVSLLVSIGIPVGLLVRSWLPDAGDGGAARTSATATPASAAPRTATSPEQKNLLTPDGIRMAIAKLKPVMGTSKATSFVVHADSVTAQALVKGSTKRYDRFAYKGEDVAVRDGMGGTVLPGTVATDLEDIDWDAVPKLLERAEAELDVERPTSRYLMLNPASTLFRTGPGISVYLSDDLGSAYLKADAAGKVIEVHPQER
ncbi:serine/threonine-protein kinase [Streptomyces hyderabadensis]|uniref:non-specific serine/threonine protein kinase n=1 Tax=Streptomyces hyderabadensis TaxID=598549 RepID=A0ABP9I887_9ACTN|nr:serine/threonine-protein kinase [Streptomyces hyderabadensis]